MMKSNKYDEVININFFYDNFPLKHSPGLINKKGKRPIKIPKKLYKQIVIEYFDAYYRDLYLSKHKLYFPFGGFMMMARTLPTIRKIRKNNNFEYSEKKQSITLIWYKRPSVIFYFCVKYEKLIGATNRLYFIEKLFKSTYDLDLLPKFETVIKKLLKTKSIFK